MATDIDNLDWTDVVSSKLSGVAFEGTTLYCRFTRSNAVYAYFDVPEEEFAALVDAPSIGVHHGENIDGIYKHKRLAG